MESQITVRLPKELAGRVRQYAKRTKKKRSDIIRLALSRFLYQPFLDQPEEDDYPYARIKHLAGSIQTGIPDLGERHREYIIQKLKQRATLDR